MLECDYKFRIARSINVKGMFDLRVMNDIIFIPEKNSHRNEPALCLIGLPDQRLAFMLSPFNKLLETLFIDKLYRVYYLENEEFIIEILKPNIQIVDKKYADTNLSRLKDFVALVDMNFDTNKVRQIINHDDNIAIFDSDNNIIQIFINGIEIKNQ